MEDPEYAVDPDKAPETFSEPYGGRSSEGGGIVSILGYIKEDLENEIGTSKKAEAASQKEFEEQRAAATQVLTDLKAKKTSLEGMEAETDEKIADATEDKESTLTMKENKEKYRESLKPRLLSLGLLQASFRSDASFRNEARPLLSHNF